MVLFKTNPMFWDDNERTGYRHVSVEHNDRVLLSVTAYSVQSKWESQVIPMGYSFKHSEIQELKRVFEVLPGLMDFLCSDTLTFDEINTFLLTQA